MKDEVKDEVNGEVLTLTAYFGERQRSADRFLADVLVERCAAADVAAGVVLRGIAGFGPTHQLRSDRSLSLSEDPPIAVTATARPDVIARLAPDVLAATTRGLVTLERARMVGAGPPARMVPDAAHLSVHIGRQDRTLARPAHEAVCEVLHRNGFVAAAAFVGVDGVRDGVRRRARFFSRNADVPVLVRAVGSCARLSAVLTELDALPRPPFVTVENAQLCKRDGELLTRPPALAAVDHDGRPVHQKLTVYTSEAALHDGVPIHRAIVARLFSAGHATGVTVLRGIWGFHGERKPHGDKLFALTRRVPVTTVLVGTPERIAAGFDIVDHLTGHEGVVCSQMVPAVVSIDAGDVRGTLTTAEV